MTLQEIEHGETEFLEFKRDFPSKDSKLMKTVAAFSNGKGGKIVFGVDDETHEIIGIENDKVLKFMDSLANMISETIYPQVNPRITFETLNDKTIIVAEILSGQNQPYFLKSEGSLDGVYFRVASTTRKAEREKIIYGAMIKCSPIAVFILDKKASTMNPPGLKADLNTNILFFNVNGILDKEILEHPTKNGCVILSPNNIVDGEKNNG